MWNRLIRRDRTQFVARKADEIEVAAKKKDIGSLLKHLQNLTTNKTPTLGPVVSRDGVLLSDEGSCLEGREDRFCSLLNNASPSTPPNDKPSQPCGQRLETNAPPDEPFSPTEIGLAVKRLKNNKAASICSLNSALLKYEGLANGDNSRGLGEGCHHPLMEEKMLKKRLLKLPGNSPAVSFQWSCWIDIGTSFEQSGDQSKLVLCPIVQPSSRFLRFDK